MPLPSPTACARPSAPATSAKPAARHPAPPTSATAASKWNRRDTLPADRATGLRYAEPIKSPVNRHGWRPMADPAHPCVASVRETTEPILPTDLRSTTLPASSYKKLITQPASHNSHSLEAVPIYATSSRHLPSRGTEQGLAHATNRDGPAFRKSLRSTSCVILGPIQFSRRSYEVAFIIFVLRHPNLHGGPTVA